MPHIKITSSVCQIVDWFKTDLTKIIWQVIATASNINVADIQPEKVDRTPTIFRNLLSPVGATDDEVIVAIANKSNFEYYIKKGDRSRPQGGGVILQKVLCLKEPVRQERLQQIFCKMIL